MRKLIIVGIIVVVAVITWLGYMRYDTQRFIKELTSSPDKSSLSEQHTKDTAKDDSVNVPGNTSDSLDPWDIWVHNQSDIIATLSEKNSDGDWPYDETYQDSVARLTELAAELKKIQDKPPPLDSNPIVEASIIQPEKYEGPQTVAGIAEVFGDLIYGYSPNPDVDVAYPSEEWIQRLLDEGASIKTRGELTGFFNARSFLFDASQDPEFMKMLAHSHGYPTESWEAFESAFINHSIWEQQTITASQQDPTIDGGIILGYNFYPTYANKKTLYVKRRSTGATTFGDDISNGQLFNLLFRGINPEGFEVIYLDSEWDMLPEKPPPITKEEVINATFDDWLKSTNNMESEWVPPMLEFPEEFDSLPETQEEQRRNLIDTQAEAAANAAKAEFERAHKEFEQAQKEVERLATLSDAELEDEFEKLILSTFPQELIPEQLDTDLSEHFTPERFEEAMSMLNQQGLEDGLRRLQQTNPPMAVFLKQHISRQEPPRQGPPQHPRRD